MWTLSEYIIPVSKLIVINMFLTLIDHTLHSSSSSSSS